MATGTNLGRIKNKKIQKNNTSGCTGVSFHTCKGQWYARIAFKGKNYNLGYFDNIQDAINARKRANDFWWIYWATYQKEDNRNIRRKK